VIWPSRITRAPHASPGARGREASARPDQERWPVSRSAVDVASNTTSAPGKERAMGARARTRMGDFSIAAVARRFEAMWQTILSDKKAWRDGKTAEGTDR
jgi:hypothetical protein